MTGVIIFFTGAGIGVLATLAAVWPALRPPFGWPSLPAGTPRAIARVRRRNRADLRHMLSQREAGVQINRLRRAFVPLDAEQTQQIRRGPSDG